MFKKKEIYEIEMIENLFIFLMNLFFIFGRLVGIGSRFVLLFLGFIVFVFSFFDDGMMCIFSLCL